MSLNKEHQEICFKLLIIGNSTVGKTCLLLRYCNNKFSYSHILTVGVDFQIKRLEMNGKKLKLSIWDTAGQEKWRTITTNYYKGSDGIVVAYSVEDQESFDKVGSWIESIKENCDNVNISILLVGNKSDSKQRVVTYEQGKKLAEQYNIPFQETSALDNINVTESFNQLAKMCLDQHEIISSKKKNQKSSSNDIDEQITGPSQSKKLTSKKKDENGESKKNCC
nr:Rab-family small GTPase Rab8E [Tetrahymena thermophila]